MDIGFKLNVQWPLYASLSKKLKDEIPQPPTTDMVRYANDADHDIAAIIDHRQAPYAVDLMVEFIYYP